MFTKVELKNFQSHTKSLFEFDAGVNAIIGPSDSGKTAILRALRWVIWNRPLGDAFRSDWGGNTSVTIEVPGNVITRWKHDNGHGYTINGRKLTAIKTDVPEDVVNILNIDEINLQQQFDRPFLLDSSAGEVAAHFNKIAHLDIIDATMRTLASWQRKLNQDVQVYESKIDEYEHAVQQFAFIPNMEKQIVKAEKYQSRIDKLDKEITALTRVIDELEEIDLQMEELTPILKLEDSVKEYLTLREEKISMETSRNALSSLVSELNISFDVLKELEALPTKETDVNEAIELFRSIEFHKESKRELSAYIERMKETDEALYNTTKEVNELQKEFDELFPDICPLCGNRKESSE